jgi:DNA modification methylase
MPIGLVEGGFIMADEEQPENGKYDSRNKLNDLTGKEWIKLTKSFWMSEKCGDDKEAFAHPAPFLIKDIEKLISLFTKKGMMVLDPFMGSGTTGIAASNLQRESIGIDLNTQYHDLALSRYIAKQMDITKHQYIVGDSAKIVSTLGKVDYIVTSPPYHNILQNNSSGTRNDKSSKGYRNGARQGIAYYTDMPNDLGNQKSYDAFISLLKNVMNQCFNVLQNGRYCSVIISDFTIMKKETCVQTNIVSLMTEIGFEFVGTTVLLQDNKPLYPFGYPFAYKINHMHQNIINFLKKEV